MFLKITEKTDKSYINPLIAEAKLGGNNIPSAIKRGSTLYQYF